MAVLRGGRLEEMTCTIDQKFRQTSLTNGPQTVLLSQHGAPLTYAQLDDLSTKLAHKISNVIEERIVKDPENEGKSPILLAMKPSCERIVAILAIWKMKNAYYVPIEPCVPRNRIKLIAREIRPCLILTCESMFAELAYADIYSEGVNLIVTYNELMDSDDKFDFVTENEGAKDGVNRVACVLYTSGSTGKPKGVMLTHRNILSRLDWQWKQFPLADRSVGIAKTSLLFVDSVTEIWSFVLHGKPIVVMQEGLRNLEVLVKTMHEFEVSRVVLVPSLLKALLSYQKMKPTRSLPSLREVICSGERLPLDAAQNFFRIFDNKVLMNFYGSTEVTGDVTFSVFNTLDELTSQSIDENVPIGLPIYGVTIKLVDDEGLELIETSEPGQIVVEGPTVMKGYLGSPAPQEYQTGDYGWIHNGRLYFAGRKDEQTKIRGNRINCIEIQKVIREAVGTDVVVMVMNEDTSLAELVAFVVGNEEVIQKTRDVCRETLPQYMMPKFHAVDKIPLSETTRKIDRQFLLRVHHQSRYTTDQCSHYDKDLQEFLGLVEKEVGIESPADADNGVFGICLDDEFVNIGGNSINKVHLASTLTDKNYNFSFTDFMVAKTVRDMYCAVQNVDGESNTKIVSSDFFEIVKYQHQDPPPHDLMYSALSAFLTKDAFTIFAGSNLAILDLYAKTFYDRCMKDDCIFLIKERISGEIVGTIIGLDSEPNEDHGLLPLSLQLVFAVAAEVEKGYDPVPEGEKVMDFYSVTTIRRMNAEENLCIVRMAEEHMIKVGKERGYYAIQTFNTNAVTQMIAKEFGYVEKGSLVLKNYIAPDGSQPFSRAPPDQTIKAMVLYLKDL